MISARMDHYLFGFWLDNWYDGVLFDDNDFWLDDRFDDVLLDDRFRLDDWLGDFLFDWFGKVLLFGGDDDDGFRLDDRRDSQSLSDDNNVVFLLFRFLRVSSDWHRLDILLFDLLVISRDGMRFEWFHDRWSPWLLRGLLGPFNCRYRSWICFRFRVGIRVRDFGNHSRWLFSFRSDGSTERINYNLDLTFSSNLVILERWASLGPRYSLVSWTPSSRSSLSDRYTAPMTLPSRPSFVLYVSYLFFAYLSFYRLSWRYWCRCGSWSS